MIRRRHFIVSGIIFFIAFFYLHLKVHTYVVAYQLQENYLAYNNILDKRDHLRYNFAKQVSLHKINQWAQDNDFSPVERERIIALNLEQKSQPRFKIEVAALLDRLLGIPTGSAEVLAEDGR
ncbi:MAG: hypothetical protein JSW17_04880 [Candidatus Omnitrophota bacterium]|nr:MAG: hypothetical protein JSW17_04880 [Candidatus Omnitrophota bacterium]